MNQKTAAPPRPSKRRLPTFVVACATIMVAFALGVGVWKRIAAPQPPALELSHVDPEVAQAIRVALDQVERKPYSARAWGELAMVLQAHELFDPARICYEHAEQLAPDEPRWPYLQAICWNTSDPDRAFACLQRAAERSTVTAPRLRYADVLIERERFDEAQPLLQSLLTHEAANAYAAFGLGRIAFSRGDLKASRAHLARAVAADNQLAGPHVLLARIIEQSGDKTQADEEWRKAAAGRSDQTWPDPYIDEMAAHAVGKNALLREAQNLVNAGQVGRAEALLVKAALAYPDSAKVRAELGKARVFQRDLPGAESELREALRLDPDLVTAHYFLGMCLRLQARDAEAVKALRRAVQLQPDHATAHFELGLALSGLNDLNGAMTAFRDAVRYKPDLAIAHKLLAILLVRANKPADALPHLQKAAVFLPDDPEIKRLVAEVKLKSP